MVTSNEFLPTTCDVYGTEKYGDLERKCLLKEHREKQRSDRNLKPLWEGARVSFPVIHPCMSHTVSQSWLLLEL